MAHSVSLQSKCKELFERAGTVITTTDQDYTVFGDTMEVTEDMNIKIAAASTKLNLPYSLKFHQKTAVHALYRGKDTVLVSPTGSGKTIITYMSLLMLRSLRGASNGVVIHLLPLNTIIEEKIATAPLKSAYILMSG